MLSLLIRVLLIIAGFLRCCLRPELLAVLLVIVHSTIFSQDWYCTVEYHRLCTEFLVTVGCISAACHCKLA